MAHVQPWPKKMGQLSCYTPWVVVFFARQTEGEGQRCVRGSGCPPEVSFMVQIEVVDAEPGNERGCSAASLYQLASASNSGQKQR